MIFTCTTCENYNKTHDCSDCERYKVYADEVLKEHYDRVRDEELENHMDLNFPSEFGKFNLMFFFDYLPIENYIPEWRNLSCKYDLLYYIGPWRTI